MAVAVLATAVVMALAGTAGATLEASAGRALNLVAYSTPKDAFTALLAAFKLTIPGRATTLNASYGASESQAQSVVNGLPADVVNFSLSPDMEKLVNAGLVSPSWDANAYKGIITRSVVVLVTRSGNPKQIAGWDDLLKPGVQVVIPNPATSGGARWDVMAAYGAELKEGKSKAQAQAYVKELFQKHVVSQDSSARNALNTFLAGKGDVLVTYETEAIYARRHGGSISYVIPKATIRIENPIAVTTKNQNPALSAAFVRFLYSLPGQTIWGQQGYRPVLPAALAKFSFPVPPNLFGIDYLGGWDAVVKTWFDPSNGIMTQIEHSLGG